jgi:hypothetical protein
LEELRALAKMFGRDAPSSMRVWAEDGKFYLHHADFERVDSSGRIHELSETLVNRINGIGIVKFGSFRPVDAGPVLQPKGHGFGVSVMPGTAILHMAADSLVAYIAEPMPAMVATLPGESLPPAEQWLAVADQYAPDVDDALILLMQAVRSESWRQLYLAYEIVADYIGQPSKIERMGWASAAEIKRFKATANSRRALGIKARHGHRRKDPALETPMTFPEARKLVRGLVREWLRYLVAKER